MASASEMHSSGPCPPVGISTASRPVASRWRFQNSTALSTRPRSSGVSVPSLRNLQPRISM